MLDYFYSVFPQQLKKLSYSTMNGSAAAAFGLERTPFFGGPDWRNVATDISRIPQEDRPHFVLAVFMIVLTDQALHQYSRASHEKWKMHTAFPKFGWVGFGPHNENPLKILWAPEREQLLDPADVISAMPDFVDFLLRETRRVIAAYDLTVNAEDLFDAMLRDRAFDFNEGTIVPAFKSAFAQALERQQDLPVP